jgi:hypothetical protein
MSKLSPAPKNESRGLGDPAEIEEVLSAAGLVEIEVMPEAKEFYFTDADEWWAFEWSQGNRPTWERLSPPDLEQFRSVWATHRRPVRASHRHEEDSQRVCQSGSPGFALCRSRSAGMPAVSAGPDTYGRISVLSA